MQSCAVVMGPRAQTLFRQGPEQGAKGTTGTCQKFLLSQLVCCACWLYTFAVPMHDFSLNDTHLEDWPPG